MRVFVYDTTLRDGSQGEGVNFSLQDKLLLTRRLDELGVDFIEGGYPLSNPKDAEYFREVRKLSLKHARVAAFGMTRRKGVRAEDDTCITALLSPTPPPKARFRRRPAKKTGTVSTTRRTMAPSWLSVLCIAPGARQQ